MRLLKLSIKGELSLTEDLLDKTPPYAILSHTWGADGDEVTFDDLHNGRGKSKAGYAKIRFCGEQARKDKIDYFWVDTCCINKANHAELSEAITSMFRWYRDAVRCYVYLSDVSVGDDDSGPNQHAWEPSFRTSKWFTRGWTLQELLAPASVEFFSQEEKILGSKKILEGLLHKITDIPVTALHGAPLSDFPVDERLRWAEKRDTKRQEDRAHCLLGIFDVFMPLIYGEGENALNRLLKKIDKRTGSLLPPDPTHWMVTRLPHSVVHTTRRSIQTLAEDHPDRLAGQQVLAGVYRANGQVKEAVALLEKVVKIREQSLGEDHHDRLASQQVLAGAYEANGQVKEAVALLKKVVKIREQSLGEDHHDRLASQQLLAGAYRANGQVKEAVALLEVAKIRGQ